MPARLRRRRVFDNTVVFRNETPAEPKPKSKEKKTT